jgi:hypothetical protein
MTKPHGGSFTATMIARADHAFRVFAYLWLLLTVYALHDSISLSHHPLIGDLGAAVLKALVLAKFMLIGEHMKLGKGLEHLPLIFPILFKSAVFSALLIGLHVIEELLIDAFWPMASRSTGGFDATSISVVLSLGAMAFVGLVPFFGVCELSRVLGAERLHTLFFNRPPLAVDRPGTPG